MSSVGSESLNFKVGAGTLDQAPPPDITLCLVSLNAVSKSLHVVPLRLVPGPISIHTVMASQLLPLGRILN